MVLVNTQQEGGGRVHAFSRLQLFLYKWKKGKKRLYSNNPHAMLHYLLDFSSIFNLLT